MGAEAKARSCLLKVRYFYLRLVFLTCGKSVWSFLLTFEIRIGLACLWWKVGLVFFTYVSPHLEIFKVAHLQSEVGRKKYSSYEFSYETCSENFPEFFEPLICGSKNPTKFAQSYSLPNILKDAPTSLCRSAEGNMGFGLSYLRFQHRK